MLKVQSITTERAMIAHQSAALESYYKEALGVVAAQFPFYSSSLTRDEQICVIKEAYNRAKYLRFTTETDHLQFLIAVFVWGSHFVNDYQFYDDLYYAGWIDRKPHKPSLKRLANRVDKHSADIAADQSSLRRIMLSVVSICQEQPTTMSATLIRDACLKVWPYRTTRMRDEIVQLWIQSNRRTAEELRLSGADIMLHSVFALYFGHRFYKDPLFPWACSAYAVLPANDQQTRDHWRMQLIGGAKEFFEHRTSNKPEAM